MSAEEEASIARQAGALGLVGTFLLVASLPLAPSWPDAAAPAGEIAVYFQANRAGVLWQAWVATLGVVLLIPLAVGLALRMRARGRVVAGGTVLAAMLLFAGVFVASRIPWIALAFRPGPPEVTLALYDSGMLGLRAGVGMPLALLSGAMALGTLDGAVLPRWLAVLALLHVPVGLLLAGCTASSGLFAASGPLGSGSLGLFTVLGVATSIALLRLGRPAATAPEPS